MKGDFLILSFASEDDSGEGWDDDGSGRLASLIPLRSDIAAGDHRALYLAWLLAVQHGALPSHATEPPVPAGLGRLNTPLKAFADFLRIDGDLIAAAAQESSAQAASASHRDMERFVAALPEAEKTAWLVRLAAGNGPDVRGGNITLAVKSYRVAAYRCGANPPLPTLRHLAGSSRSGSGVQETGCATAG